MTMYGLKLIAPILTFSIALIGGFLPLRRTKTVTQQKYFSYGDACARGIFLGVGLIHLLPMSVQQFGQAYEHHHFPYMFALCALTLLLLTAFRQECVTSNHDHQCRHGLFPYLLLFLLSVHSIIMGISLGLSGEMATFITVLLAIMIHKGAAAFALSVNMQNHHFPRRTNLILLVLFALMTPIGILFGSQLAQLLSSQPDQIISACFTAIAAGTFLHVATTRKVVDEVSTSKAYLRHFACFAFGTLIMGMVAIWT